MFEHIFEIQNINVDYVNAVCVSSKCFKLQYIW